MALYFQTLIKINKKDINFIQKPINNTLQYDYGSKQGFALEKRGFLRVESDYYLLTELGLKLYNYYKNYDNN